MSGGRRNEADILARTYRASVLVFLAALLVSLGARSAFLSLGIAAGFGLALALLASWQLMVGQLLGAKVPGAGAEKTPVAGAGALQTQRRRGLAVGLALAKLPILLAVIYVLVGRELVSPLGLLGGFAIPQVTLALLALGGAASRRQATHTAEGGLGS